MKKYHVFKLVNGAPIIGWRFKTLKAAKAFFDEKVRTISIVRKNHNSVIKFKDNDSLGYALTSKDVDTNKYETIELNCMSWKEAKEAK